ncbi:hypothetical protein EAF00_003502 [Botryotinia globosa]|nr:hypothetical protein EAF00_003502 [Botryotinia globosa]
MRKVHRKRLLEYLCTFQGADLLAAALEPMNTVVVVPVLFNGKKTQAEWFKNPSEEAKAAFVESAYAIDRWEKLAGKLSPIVERNGTA